MSSIRAQAKKAKSQAVKAKAEEYAKAEKKGAAKGDDKDNEDDGKDGEDLRNTDVVTKYKVAGEIANKALELVKDAAAKGGITCFELCKMGDAFIAEECGKVYNKGKVEKGLAFPTCISVNEIVGHFSPLVAEEDVEEIKAGDVVKIDLGAQVDGYIAVAATTVVVQETPKDKKAALMMAAHYAAECAIRLLKPGNKSSQVTEALEKCATQFGVNQVQGIVSHEMQRFIIDGEKCIQNKPDPDTKGAGKVIEFKENEVYGVDVVMSTGEGKCSDSVQRTTVYKRAVEETYKLKMKASRAIFSDIAKSHPTFPFSIRELDEKKVRFGIVECANHGLVKPYPVQCDSKGEFVAHIKFTALLMPTGTIRLTGETLDISGYETEAKLEDKDLLAIMQTSYGKKKKRKNKKKKKKKAAE